MDPNKQTQFKNAEDAASILRKQEGLSDPDDIPLDDVGAGRSGISIEEAGVSASEGAGGPGSGKRDPRIDEAAKDGLRLMRNANRSEAGQVKQSKLRCVHCFEELGRAAPFMIIVEGGKTAHCPTCQGIYP